MKDNILEAHKFGHEMVGIAKSLLIERAVSKRWHLYYLRRAALDLVQASVAEGCSLLRITIDPTFPPGHPLHDDSFASRPRRSRGNAKNKANHGGG